nr:MAG TPA: phosphoenolpyruvate carboxykinase [Caudoviricetes sp.]
MKDIKQFFSGLGERFPSQLTDEINKLEQKLKN